MPGTILWTSGPIISVAVQLSGQGASQATAVAFLTSGFFDNTGVSGGPCFYGITELTLSASGFGAALAPFSVIDFYMVPSRDGTNYADLGISGANPSPNHYRGSFMTSVSGNARMRMSVEQFPMLPVKYQPVMKNNTGQTITSGWTLWIEGFHESYQ